MDITHLLKLPPVASAHGQDIDLVMYLIHILMGLLFAGWGIFFIIAVFRFRKGKNPKANYHGVQSHVSALIEVGVVIFEAVLLIGFSIPFWAKQVNAFPKRADTFEVRVIAEQFAWNIHYPGADGLFGSTSTEYFDKQSNPIGLDPTDPNGKDDFVTINQLHLPIGRPAIIYLTSKDVIHSFFLPEMRVKQDAIPGMISTTWFTPTMTGHFEIACAQLCGIGHYRMKGFLTIDSPEDFQTWMDEQSVPAGEEEGYDDFWN